eukprot:TRINITY_DN4493_c0_g1_i1.p1 TRINITY_DN4493_c0_g1~~TRINITY_DN4493_c0_g1_i1.p1  ORF type:complete len:242 (+),score=37.30 TRINITY_DN4493_c0_g1_i1:1-726(+)
MREEGRSPKKFGRIMDLVERVLLVTAHPDDEAMFFVPTISTLIKNSQIVFLLCLSMGDFAGLGETRKKELVSACDYLEIEGVYIIDRPELKDGPRSDWPTDLISQIIRDHVTKLNITKIITFDRQGVSGHPNHISVSNGVRTFLQHHPSEITAWQLESVSMLRKWWGPLSPIVDALTFFLLDRKSSHITYTISPIEGFRKSWAAMELHFSQWVWFRRLFVIFSRYGYSNTLIRIQPPSSTS